MKCRNCMHLYRDWCVHKLDSPDPDMDRECKDYKQATNADRLYAMRNEERAKVLTVLFYRISQKTNAEYYILEWLQQPAEEDT